MRSVAASDSRNRAAATSAAAASLSLGESGLLSQGVIDCYTLSVGAPRGLHLEFTGYGCGRLGSSTRVTPGGRLLKPLGFVTGVVLGSAGSVALVLAMVVVVFALGAGERPEVTREYPGLLAAAGLFGMLAAAAGAAFVGLQRERWWRWAAQGVMWMVAAVIGWYYWPSGG